MASNPEPKPTTEQAVVSLPTPAKKREPGLITSFINIVDLIEAGVYQEPRQK